MATVTVDVERAAQIRVAKRLLTNEQARAARLSMDRTADVAARLGVGDKVIASAREGATYGPLQRDEIAAHKRRRKLLLQDNSYRLADSMIIVGPLFPISGLADQDRQERMDAAHECAHGRLPNDKTPDCGCWATYTPGPLPAATAPERRVYECQLPLHKRVRLGMRFGCLTVREQPARWSSLVECVCDCGTIKRVRAANLLPPASVQSCSRHCSARKTNPTQEAPHADHTHRELVERFAAQAARSPHDPGRAADNRPALTRGPR